MCIRIPGANREVVINSLTGAVAPGLRGLRGPCTPIMAVCHYLMERWELI